MVAAVLKLRLRPDGAALDGFQTQLNAAMSGQQLGLG